MRILFCNYEYPPLGGGGGVVMAALARQLARRHEVTALTSRAADLPVRERRSGRARRARARVLPPPAGGREFSFDAGVSAERPRSRTGARAAAFDVINTHFVVPTGPLGHALARWRTQSRTCCRCMAAILFDPSKAQLAASACTAARRRAIAGHGRPTRSSASRATRCGMSARSMACSDASN